MRRDIVHRRRPGPTAEGHYRVEFEGLDVVLPGWNTHDSVKHLLREWTATSRLMGGAGLGHRLSTQGQWHGGGQPPLLAGTPYVAFAAAEGAILAVANGFDTGMFGIDTNHVGADSIEHFLVHVGLDGIQISLGRHRGMRIVKLTDPARQVREAMARLGKVHEEDRAAIARGIDWSPFSRRVAYLLPRDAYDRLVDEMETHRSNLLTDEIGANDDFTRTVRLSHVEHAPKAVFKVSRRMQVGATLHYAECSISARSITMTACPPEVYIDALPGRPAETVLDHDLVRGRMIEMARRLSKGVLVGLAA